MTRRRPRPFLMPLLAALVFSGAQCSGLTVAGLPGREDSTAVV